MACMSIRRGKSPPLDAPKNNPDGPTCSATSGSRKPPGPRALTCDTREGTHARMRQCSANARAIHGRLERFSRRWSKKLQRCCADGCVRQGIPHWPGPPCWSQNPVRSRPFTVTARSPSQRVPPAGISSTTMEMNSKGDKSAQEQSKDLGGEGARGPQSANREAAQSTSPTTSSGTRDSARTPHPGHEPGLL